MSFNAIDFMTQLYTQLFVAFLAFVSSSSYSSTWLCTYHDWLPRWLWWLCEFCANNSHTKSYFHLTRNAIFEVFQTKDFFLFKQKGNLVHIKLRSAWNIYICRYVRWREARARERKITTKKQLQQTETAATYKWLRDWKTRKKHKNNNCKNIYINTICSCVNGEHTHTHL